MTQGSLNQTSNPLDVAIEGSGFFQVQRPDGTIAYTRAGQFQLNNQGTHSDHRRRPDHSDNHHSGQCDSGDDYPIRRSERDPARAAESVAAGAAPAGHLSQPRRAGKHGIEPTGATLSSGDPVLGNPGGTEGLGTLQQGYLENSNVDVVTMFVQMVLAQRAYESNSKVIKAADDMYSQVNNMTR